MSDQEPKPSREIQTVVQPEIICPDTQLVQAGKNPKPTTTQEKPQPSPPPPPKKSA